MKLKSLLVGILLSGISFAQNIPNYVPSNGLVAYYSFSGNANDATINGNNGTVNGATLTTDRDGNPNSAYSFDGVTSYINIGHNASLRRSNSNFSLTYWVYLNSYNSSYASVILSNRSGSNVSKIGTAFNIVGNASPNYLGQVQLGTCCEGVFGTSKILTGSWNHVVVTYDKVSKTVKTYLNGSLTNSGTLNPFTEDEALDQTIGREPLCTPKGAGNAYALNGKLDEIGIYNTTLTQDDVTALYLGCTTPIATITPNGATTFCQGNSVTLTTTKDSTYTYQWYDDNNQLNNETKNSLTTSTAGKYLVKIINGNCNATSLITNVIVNSNPTVTLNPIASLVFKNDSSITLNGNPTGGSFSGNGVLGAKFSPSKATLGKKHISYSFTTQEGCSGSGSIQTMLVDTLGNVCTTTKYDTITTHLTVTDTLRIKVKLTTGLNIGKVNSMKVYPNPTSDKVIIDNGDYASMNSYSITIIDMLGKTVYTTPITAQQTIISLNSLGSKGVYHLNIVDGNQKIVESKQLILE